MTSRFVSGGTIAGTDGIEPPSATSSTALKPPPPPPHQSVQWDKEAPKETSKKSTEWEAVQKDLEAERRRREEARKSAVEGSGEKSLYDILQANKAAKQAAFEEQNRIRNQFRALDDDEIEFLDGVRDGQREEEDRVKRETEAGLASFRRAQNSSTTIAEGGDAEEEEESWGAGAAAGRKRKRDREREIKGVVKRRTSAAGKNDKADVDADAKSKAKEEEIPAAKSGKASDKVTQAKPKPKLGLVDYGSDEDDDDDD
ncbi:N-terminal domain of NEFA-interacting nuclear protein NIP30-domain-containing protein [Camillea tinctor]|nr:N-terminal domain of NEFA-interacting nuclear protein NIP30-domain-containing protein [Camillea tinctor]